VIRAADPELAIMARERAPVQALPLVRVPAGSVAVLEQEDLLVVAGAL
jgi:hypothetical protein